MEYIASVGYFMTWISGVVMRRELYDSIEEPQKYDATHLPQVYLQMEILKRNPEFVVFYGPMVSKTSGDCLPSGFNLAEVFIKNYLDILMATVEMPASLLSVEKKRLMEEHCAQIATDKVAAYCHYCLLGLNLGGKKGFHLARLLFEPENVCDGNYASR